MTNLLRFLISLAIALACVMPASAQTTTTNSQPVAADLSILIGERQIKFTPLKAYEQIRLAVFNNAGELIFDSNVVTEAELNYNLHDSNGQVLAPGLYAYTLSIKVPGVETPRQHQGHFILEKSNDQIWLTTKGDSSAGAEVTGGALTIARSPERTTAGAGYLASGRALGERAGLQRNNQDRAIADRKSGVTREDGQFPLNISGSGTTNRHTKWLDGPNGVVGDSVIHETASGDLGIGTAFPGGVFDVQRASAGTVLQRFWNTGTGGAALRYVAATGQTSQLQLTDLAEWLMSIAGNNTGMQFRLRGAGTPNNEAQLNASARMTILRNGNVGVGTTTPAAKLEILGDIRSNALRQELTASSPNVIGGFIGTGSGGATPGNSVTAGVVGATIGGGGFNGILEFPVETLGGNGSNRVTDSLGTVGGGYFNRAGNDDATLDNALYATVGGGFANTASGDSATVGGGYINLASNLYAMVGGGNGNTASGQSATVSGGGGNLASGNSATVPGGSLNTAQGSYSLAAGRRAKANHDGAFVWADSTDADFTSTGANQFLIRASGGVGIGTTSPGSKLTVAGVIESTSGGVKFPDGTILTTAATAAQTRNPLQVALLRWYEAIQSDAVFAVGTEPQGVAFDGANIWVTNNVSANVTKLRASDGTNLGAFTVGSQPIGVAFDGANIWVANSNSDSVTRLRASDGACVGTCSFTVGDNPFGVAFDGANIWVTKFSDNNVTKLRASDGASLGTFTVGNHPRGVAFDGANIWVANNGDATVTRLRASDGACVGACSFAVGNQPNAVAFDGVNIWVANYASNNVTKLRASDGANLGTIAVGVNPSGIAFDGANIWVTNSGSATVTKLRASDNANLGAFAVGSQPTGVAFDGANVWVANSGGGTVSKR